MVLACSGVVLAQQGTNAQPLEQRQLDLRLLTHRCGEAKLSAQALRLESIWGNASRLRPFQDPATL